MHSPIVHANNEGGMPLARPPPPCYAAPVPNSLQNTGGPHRNRRRVPPTRTHNRRRVPCRPGAPARTEPRCEDRTRYEPVRAMGWRLTLLQPILDYCKQVVNNQTENTERELSLLLLQIENMLVCQQISILWPESQGESTEVSQLCLLQGRRRPAPVQGGPSFALRSKFDLTI